jgi:protease-4
MGKQQENLWLVIALLGAGFVMLFAFMFVILLAFLGVEADFGKGEGIGVVEITGVIEDSKDALKQLADFEQDDSVKGVLVRVDSPGGAVGPSQEIYHQILKLRTKKPVVVSMGSVAASGGYYIGCAGQKVFASSGTLTGSIGVIIQTTYLAELMSFLKVEPITYKAGRHKDILSPFRKATDDEQTLIQGMLEDVHNQFIEDIAKARNLEADRVREIADGRVFTGRQAMELGLVDETGSFTDAVAWVGAQTGLGENPELIYPKREALSYLEKMFEAAFSGAMTAIEQRSASRVETRLAQ